MNTRKIGLRDLSALLIFSLYPILPMYFRVGKFMIYYLMLFPAFACIFLLDKRITKSKILKPYFLYVAVMMVAFLCHMEVIEIIKFIMAPILLTLFLLHYIDSKDRFFKVIDILIIVCGIVCLFGIVEAFANKNVFWVLNNSGAELRPSGVRMGIHRIKLSFNMCSNYCNYLIVMVSLVLYRLNTIGISLRKKRLFSVINVLILMNAFFTGSRGPLIVVLLIELVVLYKIGTGKLLRTIATAVVLVIVGTLVGSAIGLPIFKYIKSYLFVFLSLFSSKFQSGIDMDFGSNLTVSSDRVLLYGWVYEGVKNHLLTGLGAKNDFTVQVNAYRVKTSVENEYLSTLLKYGLIGLGAEIYRILVAVIISLKHLSARLSFEKVSFNFVFLIGFVGYCMNFFTVSMQSDSRIFGMFIVLMLVFNSNLLRRSEC